MPELSRFYGIVIKMYYNDHNPPHFHAEYGGDQMVIDANTLAVIGGRLSPHARRTRHGMGGPTPGRIIGRLATGSQHGTARSNRSLAMRLTHVVRLVLKSHSNTSSPTIPNAISCSSPIMLSRFTSSARGVSSPSHRSCHHRCETQPRRRRWFRNHGHAKIIERDAGRSTEKDAGG